MFTVYVLRDETGKLYKGMTSNLEARLTGHQTKNTRSTRSMKKFEVIYTEVLETRAKARKREKYLKSAAGRRFLKSRLQ